MNFSSINGEFLSESTKELIAFVWSFNEVFSCFLFSVESRFIVS